MHILKPKLTVTISAKVASYLWPVRRDEVFRFVMSALLMFCFLFVQNLVRALKDAIVNTRMGPETISFLKLWGVLPVSIISSIAYVKMINYFDSRKIFYCVITSFMLFFTLFAFVFVPYQDMFHPEQSAVKHMIAIHPHWKWFITIWANWSFATFYIAAEMWYNIAFALLFWQFINQITTVEQSKRFYAIFGLIGQTGLGLSGIFLMYVPQIISTLFPLEHPAESHVAFIQTILIVAIGFGFLGIYIFWLLNRFCIDKTEDASFRINMPKTPLIESVKMIFESRYVRLVGGVVICYGLAINLVEAPLKSVAANAYKDLGEYASSFAGRNMAYSGICTIVMVVIASNLVRRVGWYAGAVATPLIIGITGTLFFVSNNFPKFLELIGSIFMFSDTLTLLIIIGSIQNIFSKASKYTLFDSTKEMAYVPLPDELKTKGKAAIDTICSKFGKSLSALIQSCIFIIFPSANYQSISIYLMCIFVFACIVWVYVVGKLAQEYNDLTDRVI